MLRKCYNLKIFYDRMPIMEKDLTTGNPLKLLIIFSVPLLIGNLFQQFYNIADIVIVGRTLGIEALAAVGATAPLFFLIMFIIVGLTNGFAVITGQRFGAKDYINMRRSVTVSTVLSSIFTVLFAGVCIIFMPIILKLMNIPQNIYDDAYWYIQIVVFGLITGNLYNLLANILRALGDSKTPLYCLIISSLLNIILALLFILKFHWGVPGSAVALIVSQAISAILCIIYIKYKFPLLHLKKSDWVFSFDEWKKFAKDHLRIGIPMALQFSVIGIGILIIQSVCNSFGSDVIASFTAALRIEQIATLPMVTFGVAIAAFVAQNYGANKINRVRISVKKASTINFHLSIVMAFVMHFWGSDIVALFLGNPDEKIITVAQQYLFISSLFYFFLAQIFIYRNALQGLGRPKIPLIACVGELAVRTFAAIYLADKFSYFGIFWSGPIAWILASTVTATGYYFVIRNLKSKLN